MLRHCVQCWKLSSTEGKWKECSAREEHDTREVQDYCSCLRSAIGEDLGNINDYYFGGLKVFVWLIFVCFFVLFLRGRTGEGESIKYDFICMGSSLYQIQISTYSVTCRFTELIRDLWYQCQFSIYFFLNPHHWALVLWT